ncbi:hypothetical protein M7I_7332 [Glarea lozoyensis 74030]|uniref:Uncharacterized protein n=1 Tax=Glarea lozoyensis (strain ATCC 74030 / MF5533) TaxID=1104152 RepID=H0EX07_GLAL7|nr:hypothetical protein M7I_7332 [Glarea lozoyensis 74030]
MKLDDIFSSPYYAFGADPETAAVTGTDAVPRPTATGAIQVPIVELNGATASSAHFTVNAAAPGTEAPAAGDVMTGAASARGAAEATRKRTLEARIAAFYV